jgi:hypothetical protein
MIRFDPANRRGIVWLASYPKSGNTWIRIFLFQLARILRGMPPEGDEINNLWRFSQEERQFRGYFEQLLRKPLKQASLPEIQRVRSEVHALIARSATDIAFLKTHSLLGILNGTPTINLAVSCGAVYLVRDPRDVAVSLSNHIARPVEQAIAMLNSSQATELGAESVAPELWGSWSDNVLSWTRGSNEVLLTLRYEDLLAAPEESFTAMVRHLRIEASAEQIALAVERSKFDEVRRQEETHGYQLRPPTTERFFVAGKSGVWREKLTGAEVDSIIKVHGETMQKFGYT